MLAAATLMPARTVVAESATATISRASCEILLKHRPGGDVAYQPGINVNGESVVPADLTPPDVGAPAQIIVDLKRPLGQIVPDAPASVAQSDVHVGELNIDVAGGQVLLNGKPVDDDSEASMIAACRRARVR